MGQKRLQSEIDEFKYQGERTPLTFGTLVIFAFCFLLLILSTFTEIDLIRITTSNSGLLVNKFIYVAQIPVFMFIFALLGVRFSISVIVLYIVLGLFGWRIFAYGGGISYLKYCAFGYLLGFIPCALLAGFIKNKFNDKWFQVALSSLTGVFSIYLTGFLYGLILLLFHKIDANLFVAETIFPSKTKLLYDIIFSILAVYLANPIKNVLWVAMKSPIKRKIKNKKKQENS